MNRLREVPAEQLYRAGAALLVNSVDGELDVEPFLPVIDGTVLPKHPVETMAAGDGHAACHSSLRPPVMR